MGIRLRAGGDYLPSTVLSNKKRVWAEFPPNFALSRSRYPLRRQFFQWKITDRSGSKKLTKQLIPMEVALLQQAIQKAPPPKMGSILAEAISSITTKNHHLTRGMENKKNPTDCSAGFLEILNSRKILEGVAEHLHGVSSAVGVTPLVVIP